MSDKKLIYNAISPIKKNEFIKKINNASIEEKTELLLGIREGGDLEFAEEIFSSFIDDNNAFLAQVAMQSLGYLSIVKKKKINKDIISRLKQIGEEKPALSYTAEETIWEIEQAYINDKDNQKSLS